MGGLVGIVDQRSCRTDSAASALEFVTQGSDRNDLSPGLVHIRPLRGGQSRSDYDR